MPKNPMPLKGFKHSAKWLQGFKHSAKWLHGHTVIYPNGKTSFATLKECQEFLRNEPWALEHPPPRRREAIEHTRRKLGL